MSTESTGAERPSPVDNEPISQESNDSDLVIVENDQGSSWQSSLRSQRRKIPTAEDDIEIISILERPSPPSTEQSVDDQSLPSSATPMSQIHQEKTSLSSGGLFFAAKKTTANIAAPTVRATGLSGNRRIPVPFYHGRKDSDLRKMCREVRLSESGDRAALKRRYTEYVNRYNTNIDSPTPRSVSDIRKEVEKWETGVQEDRRMSRAVDFGDETFAATHLERYKDEFEELVQEARESFLKVHGPVVESGGAGNDFSDVQEEPDEIEPLSTASATHSETSEARMASKRPREDDVNSDWALLESADSVKRTMVHSASDMEPAGTDCN